MRAVVAFEKLRVRIMNGDLAPGADVQPDELAGDDLGDTSVVHDALLLLVGEGLVENLGGGAFRIAPLDPQRAIENLELFQAIAASAVTWSMARLDDNTLVRLRQASARYEQAVETFDMNEATVAFDAFLSTLLGAANNRELEFVLRPIQTRFLRAVRLYLPTAEAGAGGDFVRNHRTTMEAIETRDAAKLVTHFGERLEGYRRAFEARAAAAREGLQAGSSG